MISIFSIFSSFVSGVFIISSHLFILSLFCSSFTSFSLLKLRFFFNLNFAYFLRSVLSTVYCSGRIALMLQNARACFHFCLSYFPVFLEMFVLIYGLLGNLLFSFPKEIFLLYFFTIFSLIMLWSKTMLCMLPITFSGWGLFYGPQYGLSL